MVRAEETPRPQEKLDVVCAPERPLVHPGESVTLTAWVTSGTAVPVPRPLSYRWRANKGTISGQEKVTWSFPSKVLSREEKASPATARLVVEDSVLGSATCEVRILIAQAGEPSPEPSGFRLRGGGRLTARMFLVAGAAEPEGYGLYSYLLFPSLARDAQERDRFVKATEAYLRRIQPLEELEQYRTRTQLNLLVIPVKKPVEAPSNLDDPKQITWMAERTLQLYDYARAQHLLNVFAAERDGSGPILVSALRPSSKGPQVVSVMNMSSVQPNVVWEWAQYYLWLTGEDRTWSEAALRKVSLETRNAIAVAARLPPDGIVALQGWISVRTIE